MEKINLLIVEDDAVFLDVIVRVLRKLGSSLAIHTATSYGDALRQIGQQRYELAVVDLALPVDSGTPSATNSELGWQVLQALRANQRNRDCGVIVLTAGATVSKTNLALREYEAFAVIEKDKFEGDSFGPTVKQAWLDARIKRARRRAEHLHTVKLRFDEQRLRGSEWIGPREHSVEEFGESNGDLQDFARRADNLNFVIARGPEAWRPEARAIGAALFQQLFHNYPSIHALVTARARAVAPDIRLEFNSPGAGLSLPFELLHYKGEYLGLTHPLVRRLQVPSNKTEPFHQFIDALRRAQEPLRVLLIAADPDGDLPAVETETTTLARLLRDESQCLGLEIDITHLRAAVTSYDEVVAQLRERPYHILHYAGHGRFAADLPEVSGLTLPDGEGKRRLTAANLYLLAQECAELRLVYLSCCLSARSGAQTGRGDFRGVVEALARADVPLVVGFRWEVDDEAALSMAEIFYHTLWRTLAPHAALFHARRRLFQERGADDETWASAVLLMQTN